jgi:glycosyltransferase involved in cell wall biosynthesis
VRVLAVTDFFPAYLNACLEDHVAALAGLGDDVCLLAKGKGDHPSRLSTTRFGPGRVSFVAPAGNGPLADLVTLARVVGNPSGLRTLVGEVRRGHPINTRLVKALYLLTPVAAWKPDIVHIALLDLAVAWPELLAGVEEPVVVSCRGSDLRVRPLLGDSHRRRIQRTFARADMVHCVAHELAERALALGLEPSKLVVGHWGIDTTFFCPDNGAFDSGASDSERAGQPLELVSVGRLHWVKGLEYSLQAVARLRRRGVPVSYTIIGRGNESDRLSVLAAIRDLDLESAVRVLGPWSRAEVRAAFRSSDVFVLPSVSESVNTSTLEAMAVGMPVVVTDVGGMCEAVDDGVEGLVVPPRDPDALAEAVLTLGRDPSLRATMGANGRKRVTRDYELLDRSKAMRAEYMRLMDARPSEGVSTRGGPGPWAGAASPCRP